MPRHKRPEPQPKAVPYELIGEGTDIGGPMYDLLRELVDEHHEELNNTNARIALAWATAWKPDADGRLVLGKCKKASDLDRELAPFDFVILLNRDFWTNQHVSAIQRRALLDHELMHAAVVYDDAGEPRVDERGRTVFRLRKHDLEEFSDIAQRYGCWKGDIEAFATALHKAEESVTRWIGYSALQDILQLVGLTIPMESIRTWSDLERREVFIWAQLRAEGGTTKVNPALSANVPNCLALAIQLEAATATRGDGATPQVPSPEPPSVHDASGTAH